MKESTIEKKVTEYAKKLGILSYKFTSMSNRGVPDRLFIHDGITYYVEFKALGKKPTKLQELNIKKLRDAGCQVFVIDNIERGYEVLNNILKRSQP